MHRTASLSALLHAALTDLHAGKNDQARRLPAGAARDPALRALLEEEQARVTAQAGRLEALGLATDGPACLWIKGVLDDAERDAKSTVPGPLLDIALAGAIRKGKVAEVAAGDTALALARSLGDETVVGEVAADRAEANATAAALLATIERLAG